MRAMSRSSCRWTSAGRCSSARRFDVTSGGRFDARGAAVLLWSTSDDHEGGEPVGCFYVRWRNREDASATIWRLEWGPAQGGSEEEVRRAIAVLGEPAG
jgi:hypothetical protein